MIGLPQPSLVVGRYTLYEEFACGGMASVHLGACELDGKKVPVAVKRLHSRLVRDEALVQMLLDEARIVSHIVHPHVVRLVDVVRTEQDVLLVMDYVHGASLHELLSSAARRGTRISPAVAVRVVVDVLEGLHAAHTSVRSDGRPLLIVHRDVSPQNILLGLDGGVKLTDFGVAKATERMQSTRGAKVKGKLAYMPPEQLAGGAVDARTDVYAAAVVLWEAIAHRPLFDAENSAALYAQVWKGAVTPLQKIVPSIPAALSDAVQRALARDPGRRFPTAKSFAEALARALAPADAAAVAACVRELAPEGIARRAELVNAIAGVQRRRPLALVLGVACALVLAAVAGYFGIATIWPR
jgi:serine/threonine-protein kinase